MSEDWPPRVFWEKLYFHVNYVMWSDLAPDISDPQKADIEALRNYFLQVIRGYLEQIVTQSPQEVTENLRKKRMWAQILDQWP